MCVYIHIVYQARYLVPAAAMIQRVMNDTDSATQGPSVMLGFHRTGSSSPSRSCSSTHSRSGMVQSVHARNACILTSHQLSSVMRKI
jgi:hypothetical protein